MENFEGDLEGAGHPRNEKAQQGEVLVLGFFFSFLLPALCRKSIRKLAGANSRLQPLRHEGEREAERQGLQTAEPP